MQPRALGGEWSERRTDRGKNGQTDGCTERRTDGRMDIWKFTPVSYRTSALWGRCPALTPLLHLVTPSRASGTADHKRSLDDWFLHIYIDSMITSDFILANKKPKHPLSVRWLIDLSVIRCDPVLFKNY